MGRALLANNVFTTLSAAISSTGATTFAVASNTGFPALSAGQYFYCTLVDTAKIPEIVKVTSWSGLTFTCTRGQDGSAARTFLSGATVSMRVTAAALAEFATTEATSSEIQQGALSAISKSLHYGAIVKAIIYDTSRDTDAWHKRCTDKSWYTEALGFTGAWRGQLANAAAAWAVAGAAAGDSYQNTTDGKYYVLIGTNSQIEIFRGNVREFPAVAGVVAESARVVIYDLTQVGCPMWMVFAVTSAKNWWGSSATIMGLAVRDGCIVVATTTSGCREVNFAADTLNARLSTVSTRPMGGVATRHESVVWGGSSLPAIVNNSVNDVAITVLDGAPIDPATGLPVPTIAVATAGGVSVIKQDGTVANHAFTGSGDTISLANDILRYTMAGSLAGYRRVALNDISASFSGTSFVGAGRVKQGLTASEHVGIGSAGLNISRIKENPSDPAKLLTAVTGNAYTTGWMVGDIRGAYLSDTVAETITESGELVTNGTFTTDTSGWTATNSILSVASGAMRVTATASSPPYANFTFATVIGRTYRVVCTLATPKAGKNVFINAGTTSNSSNLGFQSMGVTAGVYQFDFVATSTASHVNVNGVGTFVATDFFDVDNVSVKLAEPDRSVKNNGLIVNGTLTKTAVASGANLVAWSGFSASNYLEQPYSANHDYSTTGFGGVLWLKEAPNTAIEYLLNRESPTPAQAIRLWVSAAGVIVFELYDGTNTRTATGAVAVDDGTPKCVMFDYSAGTLNVYVNNALYATATGAALLTLNNAAATLRIGESKAGGAPLTNGSIAMVRLSATVMSAEQREFIYRTELPLFQANAQCTIAGTSTAVTALAYDDATDLLHVGTSWGRSCFKDLLRVDSEATTTGAITSLSASQGAVLTGGTSGKYYQPAMLLRDELRRKDEARKALGKVPVFFDYTATASQTVFPVPKGYTVKALYKNGTLMRETTTGVYWTRSNDGFQETSTLSVGASASDWISLMCVRA